MDYNDILEQLEAISIKLETYNDYPQSATNNAKRARKWKEKNGIDLEIEIDEIIKELKQ